VLILKINVQVWLSYMKKRLVVDIKLYYMLKGIVVVTGEVTRFMLSTENGFTCGIQFEVFSVKC